MVNGKEMLAAAAMLAGCLVEFHGEPRPHTPGAKGKPLGAPNPPGTRKDEKAAKRRRGF